MLRIFTGDEKQLMSKFDPRSTGSIKEDDFISIASGILPSYSQGDLRDIFYKLDKDNKKYNEMPSHVFKERLADEMEAY